MPRSCVSIRSRHSLLRSGRNFRAKSFGEARKFSKSSAPRAAACESELDRMLALGPENSTAHSDRGLARMDVRQYYPAISDFGDAIRSEEAKGDDYLPNNYENRGDAYVKVRDDRCAIDYTEAIKIRVDHRKRCIDLSRPVVDPKTSSAVPRGFSFAREAFHLSTENQCFVSWIRKGSLKPYHCDSPGAGSRQTVAPTRSPAYWLEHMQQSALSCSRAVLDFVRGRRLPAPSR